VKIKKNNITPLRHMLYDLKIILFYILYEDGTIGNIENTDYQNLEKLLDEINYFDDLNTENIDEKFNVGQDFSPDDLYKMVIMIENKLKINRGGKLFRRKIIKKIK